METIRNMKGCFALLLISAIIALGVGALPQPAEAACNYNGYVNSGGKCARSFNKPWKTPSWDIGERSDHYYELLERIAELRALLYGYHYDRSSSDVDVETLSATDIDEDSAELRGRLDLDDEDEADVWFEYGKSRTNLVWRTTKTTIDENDDEDFSADIDDLDDDTLYYFRAVAEDEDGDRDYGSIRSFRTDDDGSRDEEPTLVTNSARNVDEDSAELRGSVDMNDFDNGRVFFVYGEDEDVIEDIAREYDTYADIDEEGDDLQKVQVDNDLDGAASYVRSVGGLDDDTDIFFSICVEFEDEDDDDTVLCGDVESFETDRD